MDLSKFNRGGGETDFEPAPAGVHSAVCVSVIDLGTQETAWEGKTRLTPQVMLRWEIDERMTDGKRFLVSRRYTKSMHEKAGLRRALEAWRGKPFVDADFKPGGFEMSKLLGAGCQLQIVHAEKDGKTFANIASIMKLGKGMTPLTAEIEPFMLELDPETFDREAYEGLSERMKEIIAKAPEFQSCVRPYKNGATAKPAPAAEKEVVHTDDFEDEIPF